jgi:tRNA modification GTPase
MAPTETIVAPATPAGTSALALLRIDGPEAAGIVAAALGRARAPEARRPTLGIWRSVTGAGIDQVVVTLWAAGASATGNAGAEVCCHGNPRLVRALTEDCLARGARLAEPGEFTRRAFLNGRIDLTQAEAIADLIHADSERALETARRHLAGELGRAVAGWTERALATLAELEAHIDFPEEDLPPEAPEGPRRRLLGLSEELDRTARTARHASALREGIRLAVVGPPNAGKSSLLNALCGSERALVSPEAGTTRDYLEAEVTGWPLRVTAVDTAGLRPEAASVERAGMERSLEQAEKADFILCVVDRSAPPPELPERLRTLLVPGRACVVANKSDLPTHPALPAFLGQLPRLDAHLLSAEGRESVRADLASLLRASDVTPGDDQLVVGARHAEALRGAAAAFLAAARHLDRGGDESELAATQVRIGLDCLGEMVGRVDNERMLDKLFASFCIGK